MKIPQLRKIRIHQGLSQEYMGYKLGISQRHYGRLESGERTMSMNRFLAICGILSVNPAYLIQHTTPPGKSYVICFVNGRISGSADPLAAARSMSLS